jgi:hypothetical protein
MGHLRARSPSAIFTVVPVAEDVGQEGVVAGCFPRWRVGNVYIRGRPGTSTDSTAIHVTQNTPMHDQSGALPPEVMFGLAQAMPFWEVLQCLQKLLRTPSDAATPEIQEAMTSAFTSSIVATITDRVHDAMQDKSENIDPYMRTLEMWRGAAELHASLATTASWSAECLNRMLGSLSALADVVHSFFSSKRRLIATRLRYGQFGDP